MQNIYQYSIFSAVLPFCFCLCKNYVWRQYWRA